MEEMRMKLRGAVVAVGSLGAGGENMTFLSLGARIKELRQLVDR